MAISPDALTIKPAWASVCPADIGTDETAVIIFDETEQPIRRYLRYVVTQGYDSGGGRRSDAVYERLEWGQSDEGRLVPEFSLSVQEPFGTDGTPNHKVSIVTGLPAHLHVTYEDFNSGIAGLHVLPLTSPEISPDIPAWNELSPIINMGDTISAIKEHAARRQFGFSPSLLVHPTG